MKLNKERGWHKNMSEAWEEWYHTDNYSVISSRWVRFYEGKWWYLVWHHASNDDWTVMEDVTTLEEATAVCDSVWRLE